MVFNGINKDKTNDNPFVIFKCVFLKCIVSKDGFQSKGSQAKAISV